MQYVTRIKSSPFYFADCEEGSQYVATITESKTKLEEVYQTYKMNIENVQKESEVVWKPLLDNREQAQVVLENLVRTRGIAEVRNLPVIIFRNIFC